MAPSYKQADFKCALQRNKCFIHLALENSFTLLFTLNKAVYWRRLKIHFTVPHCRKLGLSCTHKNTNFVFHKSELVTFILTLSIDVVCFLLFLLFLHFLYF